MQNSHITSLLSSSEIFVQLTKAVFNTSPIKIDINPDLLLHFKWFFDCFFPSLLFLSLCIYIFPVYSHLIPIPIVICIKNCILMCLKSLSLLRFIIIITVQHKLHKCVIILHAFRILRYFNHVFIFLGSAGEWKLLSLDNFEDRLQYWREYHALLRVNFHRWAYPLDWLEIEKSQTYLPLLQVFPYAYGHWA